MNDQIRILLADDHPIVRRGLRLTLEEAGLQVIAEAADGEAALRLSRELLPTVSVLDIDMPKRDGFAVARDILAEGIPVRIIFLTLHADEGLFRAALELGVPGYILKDSATEEIAAGVRAVAQGRPYLSSAMTARLLVTAGTAEPESKNASVSQLTGTEKRILELIASGKSSKQIAAALFIHYRTVENHRTNMCRKLSLEGASALLRFALQQRSAGEAK